MRIEPVNKRMTLRMLSPLLALGMAGAALPADAAERIFADGLDPCCRLGGELTGLTGDGLVLHLDAGAVHEDKPVAFTGGGAQVYDFTRAAPPGTPYVVSITSQPSGQTCTLSNASGTVANAPVADVDATCVDGPASLTWDDGSWDELDWQ